jgi:hypothetical protein
MAGLQVVAQGAHHSGDDRLFLVIEVADASGAPVSGLKKSNFKVWQMGHFFGDLDPTTVIDIGATIPELAGVYHWVRKLWSPAVHGTFAFHVRVGRRRESGHTLTWVVKVAGGPGKD